MRYLKSFAISFLISGIVSFIILISLYKYNFYKLLNKELPESHIDYIYEEYSADVMTNLVIISIAVAITVGIISLIITKFISKKKIIKHNKVAVINELSLVHNKSTDKEFLNLLTKSPQTEHYVKDKLKTQSSEHKICKRCNTTFESGIKYCPNCGYELIVELKPDQFCPQCFTQYSYGNSYCINDGTKLVTEDQLERKCINCGEKYSSEIKYCPKDGGEVKLGSSQLSIHGTIDKTNNSSYPKAPMDKRFGAFILDIIFTLLLTVPSILLIWNKKFYDFEIDRDTQIVFFSIGMILFIIPGIYLYMKDGFKNGQSWGKSILGLMVVDLKNNLPCSKPRALIRSLFFFIPIAILSKIDPELNLFAIIPDPVIIWFSLDGKKIADKIVNTQVIEIKYFQWKVK